MNFFFDENIALRIARIVDIFDDQSTVRHQRDMFDRGTADQLWLSDLGARPERWAVISADGRILTRKPQLEALKQANLYFVLFKKSFNQLGFEQQTIRLLTLWSPITKAIKSTRNPSVFEAPTSGKKLVLKSQTSVLA